jgi:hypothetical protein
MTGQHRLDLASSKKKEEEEEEEEEDGCCCSPTTEALSIEGTIAHVWMHVSRKMRARGTTSRHVRG